MAYYSKEEITEYINLSCEKITTERHTPLTDPKEAMKNLTDEQDIVGFFWLELKPNGTNGVGINMEGRVFVRLNSEFYTDDRFALDSYHAAKEGCSVTDIIKKRGEEQKNASAELGGDVLDKLKEVLTAKKD